MSEKIACKYGSHALRMKCLVWNKKKYFMTVICKLKSTSQFYLLSCVRKALIIIILTTTWLF